MIIYVNAYSVARVYGGPEEGGWWYDDMEPLASVPIEISLSGSGKSTFDDLLPEMRDHVLVKECERLLKRNCSCMIRGSDKLVTYIEEHFAKHTPETRPVYC